MSSDISSNTMAIEIEGLTKSFGAVHALRGLDLTVPTGEVTGFLGPNGSGKTTTIRVLLGLLRADGGRASLLGGDPWADAVSLHRRIAYVPGDVTLWPNLTGGEAIDILVRLSGSLDPKRKKLMLERFELDPTKKARTYSKGNRQKVALVAALASDAELLLLDEPTSGLDPLMEAAFTESIREVKAAGKSVLLSSHIFAEVEKLADRVTIIRDGATVESGTIAELRHLTRTEITAVLEGAPEGRGGAGDSTGGATGGTAIGAGRGTGALSSLAGVHDFVSVDGRVTFAVDDSAMPAVLAAVAALGPRSLVANPPSLEALFLRHYAIHGDTNQGSAIRGGAILDSAIQGGAILDSAAAPTNGTAPTQGNQK
jgi:ABC-2 type transport system ATP-binding protein